jgi:hypothetical protein
LHRAPTGGLGITALTRVTEPEKARAAVDEAARLVREWADQKAASAKQPDQKAAASKPPEVVEQQIPCAEKQAHVFQVPLSAERPKGSASLVPTLLGNSFGIGWVFVKQTGLFVMGRDVQDQLEQSCRQLTSGASSTFANSAAFKHALGDAATRSGLLYLSLIDFVRSLEGREMPGLEPLAAAVRDTKVDRAISANWGIDSERRAFTLNVQIPLGNLLLFKPLLGALGPGRAPSAPISPGLTR